MASLSGGDYTQGMRKTSDLIWQDAQHQVLFEILDAIRQPDAGEDVIRQLMDYTETHFMLEERYMAELGYPGMAEHVAAHNRFRREIRQVIDSEDEIDAIFRDIMGTFLTEWLKRHVFGIDKELEAFVLGSGRR
jgi:hemerythrin